MVNGLISLHVMLNVTKLDKCSETENASVHQGSPNQLQKTVTVLMNLKNARHATDQNAVVLVNGKNGVHVMVHATLATEKESSLIHV